MKLLSPADAVISHVVSLKAEETTAAETAVAAAPAASPKSSRRARRKRKAREAARQEEVSLAGSFGGRVELRKATPRIVLHRRARESGTPL